MARIAAFSLSASSILFLLPKSSSALYITLLPAGIATAMVFTYTSLLVSEAVKGTRQGHALGVNQSVQVFTEAVVTAAGGFLAILGSTAPLLAGALLAFTGGHYLFSSLFKKENGAKEGE
jgi:MFS family permease